MKSKDKINGIDTNKLCEIINTVEKNPDLSKFFFTVNNTWMDGVHSRSIIKTFYGAGKKDYSRSFPFIFEIDQPFSLLGKNNGPTPVEYLLNALAGCLTNAIVFYAAKNGITIKDIESEIKGKFDLHYLFGLTDDNEIISSNIEIQINIKGENLSDSEKKLLSEFGKRSSPVYRIISEPFPVTLAINNKFYSE